MLEFQLPPGSIYNNVLADGKKKKVKTKRKKRKEKGRKELKKDQRNKKKNQNTPFKFSFFFLAARDGQKQKITELLKHIKPMARDEDWDELILTLVTVNVTVIDDKVTAESFIPVFLFH